MTDVEDLIRELKSNNVSKTNKALNTIKKCYVKSVHKMQELEKHSVLQILTSLLEHPQFCNTSLSIVADACLQKNWAAKVSYYNGVQSLTRIMKSLINDDILHRACRAIANIAKHELNFRPFQNEDLISSIIKFLSEAKQVPLKVTALRTLRILSKDCKCRHIIIQLKGGDHAIELLKSADKDMALCCVRLLAELTINCKTEFAAQLIDSVENLVDLFKQCDDEGKIHFVKWLRNLSRVETVRADLIKLGVLKVFVDALTDYKSIEIAEDAVMGVCFCLDRIHMWADNGTPAPSVFRLIVKTLEDDNLRSIHINIIIYIIRTLSFKQIYLGILIDVGLPVALLSCLKYYIKENKLDHYNHIRKDDFFPSPPKKLKTADLRHSYNLGNSAVKNVTRTGYLDFHSSGASTHRSSSISSYSINFSPSYKLGKCFSDSCSVSDDERADFCILPERKPIEKLCVCCGNELLSCRCIELKNSFLMRDIYPKSRRTVPNKKSPVLKSNLTIEELQNYRRAFQSKSSSDQCLNEPPSTKEVYKKVQNLSVCSKPVGKQMVRWELFDTHILSLLLQLSFRLEKSNSDLASACCYRVLLEYITSVEKVDPKAEAVLLFIIDNPHCFEKLIQNGFIVDLENYLKASHKPETCNNCSVISIIRRKLTIGLKKVANTDYGAGTLCHILCTSLVSHQLLAIAAVAKLLNTRSALYKSLIQSNGLSILLTILGDPADPMWEKSILYLCQIYQNLVKIDPRKNEKCCKSQTCEWKLGSKCFYKYLSFNISFVVDDGTVVKASREKLCENSDYFQALLSGHFKETNEDVVRISDISAEVLTTIFHFLHGCSSSSSCCPYITRIPFEVLLELFSESEKYLLFDMKIYIQDRLFHSLSSSTISKIYQTSKMYNSIDLNKRALECALGLDTSLQDSSLECLKQFFQMDRSFDVLSDVKILIENMILNK